MICPDRPGLVSELAGWVAANGGSIRHADHHTDAGAGLFLSRIEWQLHGFGIPRDVIPEAAQALGQRLGGEAQLHFCLLYTSPSPRDLSTSRMPSSA